MISAETVFKDIDQTASSVLLNSHVELACKDLIKEESKEWGQERVDVDQEQDKHEPEPLLKPSEETLMTILYWEDSITPPIYRLPASIMWSNEENPSGQVDKSRSIRIEKMLSRRREELLEQEGGSPSDLYKGVVELREGTENSFPQSRISSEQLHYSVDTVSMHYKRGEYKAAEFPCLTAVDLSTTLLGAEHPRTLTIISKLASIYGHLGRFEEASDLFSHVFQILSRVKGEGHADTLNCMGNLASMYHCQGRLPEAVVVLRRVIALQTLVLGHQHQNTLISKHELAVTYRDQGQLAESMYLFQEVIGEFQRVLGVEHPQTITASHNASFTRWSQGYHEMAIAIMKTCVKMRRQVLGADHPHTKLSIQILETWINRNRRARIKPTTYYENRLGALGDLPRITHDGTAHSKTMEFGTSDPLSESQF